MYRCLMQAEQLAPAYLARALPPYPQLTKLSGLAAGVMAAVHSSSPGSSLPLYVLQQLGQRARQLLAQAGNQVGMER